MEDGGGGGGRVPWLFAKRFRAFLVPRRDARRSVLSAALYDATRALFSIRSRHPHFHRRITLAFRSLLAVPPLVPVDRLRS